MAPTTLMTSCASRDARGTSKQRDGFRGHAEALMQEVVRLRSQTETMGAHLKETEAAHTAARMQWATKLEQAESEFKSDMLTREDLEKMRLTLIEETEAPWRARVKAMEAELAAAREAANAQRLRPSACAPRPRRPRLSCAPTRARRLRGMRRWRPS